MSVVEAVTIALELGAPKISLIALYASDGAIVRGQSAVHLRHRSLVASLGFVERRAVFPVFEIGEDLSPPHVLALAHVNLADHAFHLRLNLRGMERRNGSFPIHAHGEWDCHKKERDSTGDGQARDTAAFLQREEALLPVEDGLQHSDEGH